ncbi:hypothetical protein, partial [Acidovorax sp.]|uniref:hypothetical protein n=1 Tax=Acidovorax sp. TaxID=1872122 RepID=UPI00391F325C
ATSPQERPIGEGQGCLLRQGARQPDEHPQGCPEACPGEEAGSQLAKAEELGVPVIDEAGMLALLAGGVAA